MQLLITLKGQVTKEPDLERGLTFKFLRVLFPFVLGFWLKDMTDKHL